jgi:hypothetical protein
MAIFPDRETYEGEVLNREPIEYEIRIKRYPEGTYFEEHVKTEVIDWYGDNERERYIIGESGTKFTVEVTLKKGFYFGDCDVRLSCFYQDVMTMSPISKFPSRLIWIVI